MTEWLPIQYRDFWDVPHIFLVRFGGRTYLFDCPFSEALDDYPDVYSVFTMPDLRDDEIPTDWSTLSSRATRRLADVPVPAVRFDPTRRAAIGAEVFDRLAPAGPPPNGTTAHADAPPAHIS